MRRFPLAAPLRAAWLAFAAFALPARAADADAAGPWRLDAATISVRVRPLAPEGVAAFLMGRGMPSKPALQYASSCVMRVVVREPSGRAPIAYDLRDWRVRQPANTAALSLGTREAWMERLRSRAMDLAPALAFRFSQLPTRAALAPGDSVQGMTTVPLPSGSRFDLSIRWTASNGPLHATLEGIRCHAP